MAEKELQSFLKKIMNESENQPKPISKQIQYVMDFGELTIQYDYCLN